MATHTITLQHLTGPERNGSYLSINNTFVRCLLARIAFRTTAKLYKHKANSTCIPISPRKLIKKGHRVHLAEAAALHFVNQMTQIPVPRVYCAFVRETEGEGWIVMERVRGRTLDEVWESLGREELKDILKQLRGMVKDLRGLKPLEGGDNLGVSNCVGGSLQDPRFPRGGTRFGPCADVL
ncbi:hypothetical protein K458DRAFT_413675 [Lentithecium fluviatile CBS 122367]|uniref:Aminoglycoside phosphotransferase domain-containing protein n=1 Tax=Lentithecium fluviatile CBS 122367 TaxID=1168545 RepID=A0A6G1JG01_9PLEO|nr:hypothetical protein K458DRAFT_413675 [Lentithecium fluviatile CBS 122367]